MSDEHAGAKAIFGLLWLYWAICSIIWAVRNPTANVMTVWTRLPHVVSFSRLAEYQVVETYESIGKGPWTAEKAAARQAELLGK